MGNGELEVDPEALAHLGTLLQESAARLPAAPAPLGVVGADAISLAIKEKLPDLEGGILQGLPEVRTAATNSASNVVSAAGQYQDTDQQSAAEIAKAQLDSVDSAGGGTAGSGSGGGAMGQLSQLMSMPMQMASQVAQLPVQAMGAVSALPQSVMQGVQQVSQMAGGVSGAGNTPGGKPDDAAEDRTDNPDDSRANQGAAPGAANVERAPEATPNAEPATSPAPQQGSPRHAAPDPAVDL